MSADAESFLFDSHAPVHTGTGNQINGPAFFLDSTQRLGRVGRDPRVVAREHLRWLNQRFIEPDLYGRARELLAATRSVLLTGALGSGRRSTAQMLLHRLDLTNTELIRELPDDDTGGPLDGPVLDAQAVGSGERLLLDLSTSEETYCAVVLGQLPLYRAEVRKRGAHLVVVLPRSREHHWDSELGPSVVEIARPKGREVFRRYLRCDGVTRSAQLDGDELMMLLHSEPMQQIAKLAGLVRLAKESEPTNEFPHWRDEALKALTERSDEVARQMTALGSGQQRALLLTTAMFSGAHADAVFEATSTLRKVVEHPEDDRPRLEREGVAEQLAKIGANADDAGLVRFRLLAYEQAVRNHFWTNFPDLRVGFRDWVATAIGQRTLTPEDRNEVVIRFAEQALRTGRRGDLLRLVERWAKRTDARGPSILLPQAAKALERGLSHERHGGFFRHQLYTWSRDPGLSQDLAQVVVQVCSGVLALTHPEQALVRLHHIVRRHSDVARSALLDLIDSDRRLYRRLLDRVMSGLMTTENRAADLALFLDLAGPARLADAQRRTQPLIADTTVRGQLVTGWNAVLSGPSWLRCAHYVHTWLACEDSQDRELLLDVLVEAGDRRYDLLSRLHVIARNWADAPDDRLSTKIDSALGFDFIELELGERTEGTSP